MSSAYPERDHSFSKDESSHEVAENKDNVIEFPKTDRAEVREPKAPLSGSFAESMALLTELGYHSYAEAYAAKEQLAKEVHDEQLSFWEKIKDKIANSSTEANKFIELEHKYELLNRRLRVARITAQHEGIDIDKLKEVTETPKDNVVDFPNAA